MVYLAMDGEQVRSLREERAGASRTWPLWLQL
jgi:hypothetical protein